MDYQVILSSLARSDIENIVKYISIDNAAYALRFGKFLLQHTRRLGHFPELGRVVPEFQDESIREIIVRTYRVIYRVMEDQRTVEVIRFWHAARGIPEITRLN